LLKRPLVAGKRQWSGAERASAWSAALLVDDFYAVGGVHDRLVLLVAVHLVVLMPGLAKDLNDLAPTSGRTVDTVGCINSIVPAGMGVLGARGRSVAGSVDEGRGWCWRRCCTCCWDG
jgi:hypothetical protein